MCRTHLTSVGMGKSAGKIGDVKGARILGLFGDKITTDHISPAGSIKAQSPAGKYLIDHGVGIADFNQYGTRRGNHEVMMRAPSPTSVFATTCWAKTVRKAATPSIIRRRKKPDLPRRSHGVQGRSVPLAAFAGVEYGNVLRVTGLQRASNLVSASRL